MSLTVIGEIIFRGGIPASMQPLARAFITPCISSIEEKPAVTPEDLTTKCKSETVIPAALAHSCSVLLTNFAIESSESSTVVIVRQNAESRERASRVILTALSNIYVFPLFRSVALNMDLVVLLPSSTLATTKMGLRVRSPRESRKIKNKSE